MGWYIQRDWTGKFGKLRKAKSQAEGNGSFVYYTTIGIGWKFALLIEVDRGGDDDEQANWRKIATPLAAEVLVDKFK